MATTIPTFMVEDAAIIYLNFEGREGQYNRAGDRNFHVVLDPEMAQAMLNDGWNVKFREPRELDEGEVREGFWHVEVTVNFNNKPPQIFTITNDGKTRTHLTENMVSIVDSLDIAKVDLFCNGSRWTQDATGKSGIKAYLKTMYITVNEDPLERKYADVGTE